MRTKKTILILSVFSLVFIGCKEDKNLGNNVKSESMLLYEKTELGFSGCGEHTLTRNDFEIKSDTVIITISEDFVNVFVNLAFGARKYEPFETQVEIIENVLYMYIIDVCYTYDDAGDYNCYGRCGGSYTFDFIFRHGGEINQKYKILLISHWRGYSEKKPFVFSEGIINLKNH